MAKEMAAAPFFIQSRVGMQAGNSWRPTELKNLLTEKDGFYIKGKNKP